jgi:hypothetical protein
MEVNCQLHAPDALPLRKVPPVSFEQEAGWASEKVWTLWRREKSLVPAGNRSAMSRMCSPWTGHCTELSLPLQYMRYADHWRLLGVFVLFNGTKRQGRAVRCSDESSSMSHKMEHCRVHFRSLFGAPSCDKHPSGTHKVHCHIACILSPIGIPVDLVLLLVYSSLCRTRVT